MTCPRCYYKYYLVALSCVFLVLCADVYLVVFIFSSDDSSSAAEVSKTPETVVFEVLELEILSDRPNRFVSVCRRSVAVRFVESGLKSICCSGLPLRAIIDSGRLAPSASHILTIFSRAYLFTYRQNNCNVQKKKKKN